MHQVICDMCLNQIFYEFLFVLVRFWLHMFYAILVICFVCAFQQNFIYKIFIDYIPVQLPGIIYESMACGVSDHQ